MSNIDPIRLEVELTGADQAAEDLDKVSEAARDVEAVDPALAVDTSQVAGAVGDLDRLKSAANDADTAIGNVGDSAGSGGKLRDVTATAGDLESKMGGANNALANFAGNAVTELPGVSGAFGPLAQGVGEMAEGLAAGELSMKDMAMTAGAMGAVALVVKGISDHMNKIAEAEAFEAQEVKDYTKAIQEAEAVAELLRKKLDETGKVELTLGLEMFGRMMHGDIVPALDEAGQSLDDFGAAVEGGEDHIAAWGEAMRGAGVDVETVNLLTLTATQQADQLATAHENSERVARLMGDEYETAAQKAKRVADEQSAAEQKTKDLDAAWQGLLGTLSDDEALLNLKDSFDDAQAAADEAFKASSEGAVDTEAKTRDAEQALIDLKQEVAEYAKEVLKLPPSQTSEIIADMDWGSLQATEAELEQLARDREANLYVRPSWAGPGPGTGWGGNIPWGRSMPADAPTVINVTQHLPAGYGAQNTAIREAHQAARRSGGLYSRIGRR